MEAACEVLGALVPVLTVGVSAEVTGADVVADVVAVAGVVMLVLATTELYCCISITAASSRTFKRFVINYTLWFLVNDGVVYH